MSRTLNLQGTHWMDCPTPPVAILDQTTSTLNLSAWEVDKLDTSGLFLERQRQENGQWTQTRWQCTDGSQTGVNIIGGGAGNPCFVGVLGQSCQINCEAPFSINAQIQLAAIGHIYEVCGGTVADCEVLIGACSRSAPPLYSQSDGVCYGDRGIYVIADCYG